ncbi:MAG: flavodoxin-dependent (E)-4-hydroxy-3-methylbut-2-enyl-diphosphate synthase, partial [Treponemataceae bacterium]|nr:flavodoxin-dependent (E)-4-hydroxy-3-methylbut-2-enyl-diphosphate synthase [Treponemataceae bacterium]
LHLRERGVELISCPTCGRCQIDLFGLAEEAERRLLGVATPLKVAIMGCVVNGPGEAREADVGIAGGKGVGALFKKGELVRQVPEGELLEVLLKEVAALTGEKIL